MRAEVPRSFGFEPEGWFCQQIVQIKAASNREGGQLGDSLWLVGLPVEEEDATVLSVGGQCILQRRTSEGEGMKGQCVEASMILASLEL